MTIWERLGNLDRRYYYVLLIVVVAWPVLKPWGLPVMTGPETAKFHKAIEGVPAGGIIALAIDYRTDSTVECNPMVVTLFRHALKRGVKIIMFAGMDEGALVSQAAVAPVAKEMGKQYGVDWINLGYKPGGEVTMKKMVDNFPEAVAYCDMNSERLEKFPIMAGFDTIKKAALLVNIQNIVPSPSQDWLKMVCIPTGLPLAVGTVSVGVPTEMPFFASGQYQGLLCGLRGAAEYELMTGDPGPATTGMDAQSAAHFLVIALILLGNIEYFVVERRRKAGFQGSPKGGGVS